MPVLDDTHTVLRLHRRITELEAGKEIAIRDIKAVLNVQQKNELDTELATQKILNKKITAKTDEEKKALGWRTIREVRLEVLKRALALAETRELDALKAKQHNAEVRRARIYLEAFKAAIAAGKSSHTAHTWANNELTRAGLSRMDGWVDEDTIERDNAVREIEEAIKRKDITADELEQIELLKAHFEMLGKKQNG